MSGNFKLQHQFRAERLAKMAWVEKFKNLSEEHEKLKARFRWNPPATAPKDESDIIVWYTTGKGRRSVGARWSKEHKKFLTPTIWLEENEIEGWRLPPDPPPILRDDVP